MKLDLTNKRFGHLLVLGATGERQNRMMVWRCRCDCGNEIEKRTSYLTSGDTKSCGCLKQDILVTRNMKHGHTKRGKVHFLYSVWHDMKNRCNNPNNQAYKHYGGRGILVCAEWENDFEAFRNYVLALDNAPTEKSKGTRTRKEIDRIRNAEGYKPGNIRWVSRLDQMNNTRNNRMVTINQVSMTFAEAVRQYGKVPYKTVWKRISNGWSTQDALLTPASR